MQALNQRDPRWASQKLGFGTGTIHSYGCTITSLAMLLGTTPDIVNKKMKSANAFGGATKNLVVWSKLKDAFPQILSATRYYNYDNDLAKKAIENYGGVLVEVDGSRIGASRHWVLYIGGGKMLDPWFGNEKATSYYKPLGMTFIEVQSIEESMPEDIVNLKKDKFEELVTKSTWYDNNHELISEQKQTIVGLEAQVTTLKNEHARYREQIAKLLGAPVTADAPIDLVEKRVAEINQAEEDLRVLKKEKDQLEKKHELERQDWQEQVKQLRSEIEQQQKENETLLGRLEALEEKAKDYQQIEKTAQETITRFIDWIKKLLGRKQKNEKS